MARVRDTTGVGRQQTKLLIFNNLIWRRERDSNPRCPFRHSGFQDRLFQPLTHPSAFRISHFREVLLTLSLDCPSKQTSP